METAIVRFHRDGYHHVSMDDIASDVGISAGALYRHFRSKQDLLFAALSTLLDEYEELGVGINDPHPETLLAALARHTVRSRERGLVWQRYARDLAPDQHEIARARLRGLAGRVAAAVQTRRPELDPSNADMVAWAVLAVLASPFEHRVTLSAARFESLLTGSAVALCDTPAVPARDVATAETVAVGPYANAFAASTHERIVAAAGQLIREQGFDAVSMESIGAAVGITAASVYNHFPSKSDVLLAVYARASEGLRLGLSQALSRAQDTDNALELVVRSYVSPALRPDGLSGLLFRETARLPESRQQSARRVQREYVDRWARLVELPLNEARIIVHAAIALVNSLVTIPHLRARAGFEEEVVGLALDVLRGRPRV
ncbi:TetR/AcrR family transcriptional regulator [Mumia sp. Pv 4-285]|uniref:TetR/AcrR family transcriptional regulator n=1 Tax=Mumia qirimensis TaxID=3234852 RepID=UPI00351CCDAB